jgi:hypothetical protein
MRWYLVCLELGVGTRWYVQVRWTLLLWKDLGNAQQSVSNSKTFKTVRLAASNCKPPQLGAMHT